MKFWGFESKVHEIVEQEDLIQDGLLKMGKLDMIRWGEDKITGLDENKVILSWPRVDKPPK